MKKTNLVVPVQRNGVIDILHPGPRPGGICKVCNFDPSLSHNDRKRLIAKGKTECKISIPTNFRQLSEASTRNGCRGCALLHSAFTLFYGKLAPNHPIKISLQYTERSPWESSTPGTALLGLTVEFTDVTKEKPGYVADVFEFFSPKGPLLQKEAFFSPSIRFVASGSNVI